MLPRPLFALVFALILVSGASAHAQDQAAAPADSNSDKPQATPPTPPGSAAPTPAQDAPKASAKPRHVITNEDIEDQREQLASANSDVELGDINDCDKTCFDWVRNMSPYFVRYSPDWKHDLLHGIDEVSADAKWQKALYRIARMKSRLCELCQDMNDDLSSVANPKNMTEDEIALEDDYDRKFQAEMSDLNAANADADAIIRTHSGIVVSFMNLQKQRAVNRGCVIRYPMMYRPYRSPVDDPGRP